MRARKIGLLILILASGGALETAWNVRHHLDVGPSGCRVLGGRFYGESHAFEETLRRPLASGIRVEVVNSFGSVESALGEAGELQVAFEKVVYLDAEERARRFAEGVSVRFEEAGSVLRVASNRDEVEKREGGIGFETHLRLRLPPGTALVVRNEHGRVDVSDVASLEVVSSHEAVALRRIAGDTKVETRHADVKAEGIQGALSLSSRYGSVELNDVKGPANLEVEHADVSLHQMASVSLVLRRGDLTAEDVRGELKVTGEHNGVSAVRVGGGALVESGFRDVSLSEIAGDTSVTTERGEVVVSDARGALAIETSFGDVKLDRIAGPVRVSVEHGGLRAHGLAAGLHGKVSGDDVTLEDLQGTLDLEASRASVRVSPKAALVDDVRVLVRNGGIRLSVPESSRFALEASVRGGQIELDEIAGLTLTREGGDRVTGRIGEGGGRVTLEVEHGDITLQAHAAVRAEKE